MEGGILNLELNLKLTLDLNLSLRPSTHLALSLGRRRWPRRDFCFCWEHLKARVGSSSRK